jgi:chemotaxis protein methyltransferase CheR
MEASLSMIQYKEVLEILEKTYNISLSQHSINALRQNILHAMQRNKIYTPQIFTQKLQTQSSFAEDIQECLYCEHINIFRDPAFWRILKSQVLDPLLEKSTLQIWVPEVSKGSELYSLLILLDYYGLIDKARILATDSSVRNLAYCKQGIIADDIVITSTGNFERFDATGSLQKYLHNADRKYTLRKDLLRHVSFQRGEVLSLFPTLKPNIVLFRNKMIYYLPSKSVRVINYLHQHMEAGGFLITGVQENIEQYEIERKFRIHHKEEQIYRRNFQ